MTQEQYIEWLAPRVVLDSLNRNLLPSPRIAQGCFEPAYGTSELAVKANNLFGVKVNDQWEGKFYNKVSGECYNGKDYEAKASDFQAYDSWEDSIYWQGWYLENRCMTPKYHPELKHYAELIGNRDYKDCARILHEKKYGTSPEYAKRVITYIEKHNLTQYDSMTREEAMEMIRKDEAKIGGNDMGYTNSSLVNCKVMSPNHSGKRTHTIDRITPHCVVGQLSAERIGGCFDNSGKQASCNYGIGTDGRVCLIVDEANRSWCSSSASNDQRAITIECASDKTAPYAFNDKVYNKLIDLCVDICKRNGKKKLLWFADKNQALNYNPAADEMVLTVHRWFKNKACPGNWMYSRMGDLAEKVTAKLNPSESTIYRVQSGAFSKKTNANNLLNAIKQKGFDAFITMQGSLYKVQCGAFSKKANAENLQKKLKSAGFEAVIVKVNK